MASDIQSRVYEAMFLVDSGDAAMWDEMSKHLASMLTRSSATVIGMTRWDERKLCYTVKGRKRGTYVLAFFIRVGGGAGMAEIERDCRLSEKVLRALLLKADHFTVADMRLQLGEDIHEDVAQKLMTERGEKAVVAAAVVAKPPRPSDAAPAGDTPAAPAPPAPYERRRRERSDDY
jgi:ribosomal protein S6